jgi:hypothetical protein
VGEARIELESVDRGHEGLTIETDAGPFEDRADQARSRVARPIGRGHGLLALHAAIPPSALPWSGSVWSKWACRSSRAVVTKFPLRDQCIIATNQHTALHCRGPSPLCGIDCSL